MNKVFVWFCFILSIKNSLLLIIEKCDTLRVYNRFSSIAKICQAGGQPYCDTVTLKFARYNKKTLSQDSLMYTVVHIDSNVHKLQNKMYLLYMIFWHNKSKLF